MTIYTENCNQSIDGSLNNGLNSLVQRVYRWVKIQQLKINVRKEREQLLAMSNAMLSDLGVTRAQAQKEARKADLPAVRLGMLDRELG